MERETCSHNYRYSHKEQEHISTTGTTRRYVDVLVCKKCADIKRRKVNIFENK